MRCEPLNRIWLLGAGEELTRAYSACTCGQRFGIGGDKPRWRQHLDAARSRGPGADQVLDNAGVAAALASVPAADRRVRHAAPGVVPVGHPAIHRATDWVDPADPQVADLAAHMLAVMDAAPGIGLAANQVGAPVRVLALNFPALVPQVWVNPVLVTEEGEWRYEEGCLSLEVEGSHAEVVRPGRVTVVADLPGEGHVVVEASELLARVIQHELDHLEGIEYVQRLEGQLGEEVYALLDAEGIDVDLLPPRPYAA